MTKILFQGDSITDAGRNRDRKDNMGMGYPMLTKAALAFDDPGKYEFVNRGISGNRIVDLYARMKKDIINIAPDVMSILIGVNDVWHEFEESPNGVDAEKFYKVYCMLIEEVLEALPNIKIFIMEPFALCGTGTEEHWDVFPTEVAKRAEKTRMVAEKYDLPFVPLQEKFEKLAKLQPVAYWLKDGVHPTEAGHEFLKREWLSAFYKL